MNYRLKPKPEILTELRQNDLMFIERYPFLNILLNILPVLRVEITQGTIKLKAWIFEQVELSGLSLCNMLTTFRYEVGADD